MSDPSRGGVDDLLRANREFYRAFASGDFVAMDRLWTELPNVMCLHPGWEVLRGRERVMASWNSILRRPLPVKVRDEVVEVFGEVGVVVCVEVLREVELAATNLFVLEQGRWRLAHHQAGLIARGERDDEDDDDEDDDDDEGKPGPLLN